MAEESIAELFVKLGMKMDPAFLSTLQTAGQHIEHFEKGMKSGFGADLMALKGAVSEVTEKIASLGEHNLETAESFAKIHASLAASFSDTSGLESAFSMVKEMSESHALFSPEEWTRATKTLNEFGQAGEENLTRVGNAAVHSGKSMEEVAQIFARAAAGDQRSLLMLSRQFHITHADLERLGGGAEAVGRAFDEKFGGSMDRAQTPIVTLQGKMEELRAQMGAGELAAKNLGATIETKLIEALLHLGPAFNGALGVTVSLGVEAGKLAGGLLQTVANVGIVLHTFPGLTAAITGAIQKFQAFQAAAKLKQFADISSGLRAGAISMEALGATAAAAAGPISVILGLAIGIKLVHDQQMMAAEAANEAMVIAQQQAKALDKAMNQDWAHKSGQQLHELGVNLRAMASAQGGLNAKIQETNASTELSQAQKDKLIAGYQKEKIALRDVARELAEYEKKLRELAPNVEKSEAALEHMKYLHDTEQATSQQLLGAAQAHLDALNSPEGKKLYDEKYKDDQDQADREYQKALDAAAKEVFDISKSMRDNLIKGSEELSAKQAEAAKAEVERVKEVLSAHQAAGSATKADEEAITAATIESAAKERDAKLKEINDRQTAEQNAGTLTTEKVQAFMLERSTAEAKYTADVVKENDRRIEADKQRIAKSRELDHAALQQAQASNAVVIQGLEYRRSKGENVDAEMVEALRRKLALDIQAQQQTTQMAVAAAKTKEEKQQIEANGEAAIRVLKAKYHQDTLREADEEKRAAAELLRIQEEAVNIRLAAISDEMALLENRHAHNQNVEAEEKDAIGRKLQAELAAIELRRQADLQAEENPKKRAVIEQRAAQEAAHARQEADLAAERSHESEMQRQAEEIRKARETVELRVQASDIELKAIEKKRAAGLATEEDVIAAMRSRLELQLQAAQMENDAAVKAANNDQDRQRARENGELRLKNLRAQAFDEAAQQLEKQDKTLGDEIKKMEKLLNMQQQHGTSPLMSLAEAFGDSGLGGGFSIGNFGALTQADVEKKKLEMADKMKAKLAASIDSSGPLSSPSSAASSSNTTHAGDTINVSIYLKDGQMDGSGLESLGRQIADASRRRARQLADAPKDPQLNVLGQEGWSTWGMLSDGR